MSTAWIGLGGNQGDPSGHLARACAELDALPATRLVARSRIYRSPPWGPVPQADFLNAVARLDTEFAPVELLRELQAIEAAHGRRRDGKRWGPRPLDLDILLYDDATMDAPELTLPHPRLAERAFVLVPLAELAPALDVPGRGTAAELAAHADAEGVVPVEAA